MANERTYIKDASGRIIAHVDTIGDGAGAYYNYVVNGRTYLRSFPELGDVGAM